MRLRAPRRLPSSRSLLVSAMLLALAIPLVFPLYWMVSSSFKGTHETFAYPPVIVPEALRLDSFQQVFELQPFALQYANSLYIAVLNVIGTMILASLSGYAFARIRFPGRNLIFVLFLAALLMPLEVLIIPLYIIMRDLGWLGTHLPLIIEPIVGAPAVVATFLMRQYFLSLPVELEDAGRIDGLGRFGLFRRIALPLARPALATVAILTFLTSWNSFLEPLIFVSGTAELMTIPVAIDQFVNVFGQPYWEVQMAASTLSVIPVLLVFIVAQRQFVQGLARVGVQG